jgi:hypothetical protein
MEVLHWKVVGLRLCRYQRYANHHHCNRNRAELSEGWYDPVTLQRAIEVSREDLPSKKQESEGPSRSRPIAPASKVEAGNENETSSDDEMGPALPGQEHNSKRKRMAGPSIPNMQDLELKRGNVIF